MTVPPTPDLYPSWAAQASRENNHYPGCWRDPGHHYCAIVHAMNLESKVARYQRLRITSQLTSRLPAQRSAALIAEMIRIDWNLIAGSNRSRDVIIARRVIAWALRHEIQRKYSGPEIAQAMGRPNHSSIFEMLNHTREPGDATPIGNALRRTVADLRDTENLEDRALPRFDLHQIYDEIKRPVTRRKAKKNTHEGANV